MTGETSSFSLPGFRVGHWTHESGQTGCSVVIPDEPALAVVDVRGGAPGTRETSLLEEGRMVQRVNAVLLTGGSAFGLSAADGVVRWLREQRRGFPTASIPVPIVSAAVLFDLKGDDPVWPNAQAGYECAAGATEDQWVSGRRGAGTGATVAKILNHQGRPSGIGAARIETEAGTVAALMAVNAVGEIATAETDDGRTLEQTILSGVDPQPRTGENTTIGVVAIDGALERDDLVRIAVAAHDGLARAIHPAHTIFDGDTIFVLCRHDGTLRPRDSLILNVATQHAVMRAIINATNTSTAQER
ncbi:MAG: P1 family peptidase [Nitrolancea sp.]